MKLEESEGNVGWKIAERAENSLVGVHRKMEALLGFWSGKHDCLAQLLKAFNLGNRIRGKDLLYKMKGPKSGFFRSFYVVGLCFGFCISLVLLC